MHLAAAEQLNGLAVDIILWRHAEAEPGFPDLERKLTAKGERQAEKVGAWLDNHLPPRTRIIVSPAVRAQQTAQSLKRRFTTIDAIAPGASAEAVLNAAGWPDALVPVLVVGHQPVLGEIASLLLTGREGSWSVRKASVWWLSQRELGEEVSAVLRVVIGPDLA